MGGRRKKSEQMSKSLWNGRKDQLRCSETGGSIIMFDRDECVASLVPTRQPDVSQHDPCVPSDMVETDGVLSPALSVVSTLQPPP